MSRGLRTIEQVERRFGEILDDVAQDCDRDALLASLGELARLLSEQIEARVRPDA